jgi:Fic family protein
MTFSGKYRINLKGEMEYRSFIPTQLPLDKKIELDDEIIKILTNAHRSLMKLEVISTRIPSVPLFVSMYVRKEALLSSQIEGTQATLDDILDPDAEKNNNINVEEVINYIKASDYSIERLKTLPICKRLILETHEILLKNIRGGEKNPGEFRNSQNWIGPGGSTLKNARYIPPNVEDMNIALDNLEKYINSQDETDPLIKIALIHYQFETIHPFLDGNGRIGRLLINLFLRDREILTYPTLYISYYLKRNRIEYYDRLNEVREKDNYVQWIKFFLKGIFESAEDALSSIDKLIALHDKNMEIVIQEDSREKSLLRLFEYIEKKPIIEINKTAKELDYTYNTVSKNIKKLENLGVLKQSGAAKRNRNFVYEDYLNILRKDT